jgi:HlyD family secretion protein
MIARSSSSFPRRAWVRATIAARHGWSWLGLWIERRIGGPSAADPSVVHAFKPDAAAIEEAPIPISANSALYVILTLLLVAVLWSIFGTLDRVVVAQGRVVTTQPMIVMQPFTTSRVLGVHVKPGDRVRKDQVLVSFDPAFAAADEATLAQRVRALAAEIDRIDAELSGERSFAAGVDSNPEQRAQAEIFAQRMSQFAAEIAVRDSRQRQVEAQIESDRQNAEGLRRQLELARRVADIRRELLAKDAGSALESMVAEKEAIEAELRLQYVVGNQDKLRQQRAEVLAERQSFIDGWRGALNERLAAAAKEAAEAGETLNKARRMKDFAQLVAPVDGVVLELADISEGSVLREATTLVTLVPADAQLTLEANILSRDVGFVAVGDPVRVKLEAYPFQQYGTLEGHLDLVGPDSVPLTENDRTSVVFPASIDLAATVGNASAQGIRLRPGLVATAEIKTGVRSIASYILDPILRTRDESMREP